jgi:acyl carrier protein
MTTAQLAMSREQLGYVLIELLQSIAPEADYEALDYDADLTEALDIDSFDFLNFLIGLESELGVTVPEADYGQLVSLNDIIDYVMPRLSA